MSRTPSPRARSTDPAVPRRNGQPRVLSRVDQQPVHAGLYAQRRHHVPAAGQLRAGRLDRGRGSGWQADLPHHRRRRVRAEGAAHPGAAGAATRLRPRPRDHQGLAAAAAGQRPARVQAGAGAPPRPLGRGRGGRGGGAADAGLGPAERYRR
ncbi:hypothetical protein G6F32_014954 [Rhizopus arrhizus]|nr:hypothetical protein G6F32_014954 [Rhizopus arrhizus]